MKKTQLVMTLLSASWLISCQSSAPEANVTPPPPVVTEVVAQPVVKKKVVKKDTAAKSGYRLHSELWDPKTKKLKSNAPRRLVIDTKTQRGRLYSGDKVVMNFPVTTGKAGKRTPKGTFSISEKVVDKRSNLYGSFVNSKKRVVRSGVSSKDKRPKGTSFQGAKMPYWMRINGSVGIHQGPLRSRPASNGCVRVPASVAPVIYKNMQSGGKVEIR